MTDAEKRRHIMKGIRDETFQLLVVKSPKYVLDFVSTLKALEDSRRSRSRLTYYFQHSENTVSPNTAPLEALLPILRDIVREELGCQTLGSPYAMPPVPESALHTRIHQEIAAAVPSSGLHSPQSPYDAVPVEGYNATQRTLCLAALASAMGVPQFFFPSTSL